MRNAFNSVSRQRVFEAVRRRCPQAAFWFESCYSHHSKLFIGESLLGSQRGLQQGDPCGPAGFCWAVHDVLEAIEEFVEWQAWYLDDGVLVGTPEQLHNALETLISGMSLCGLEVNLDKCVIWGPAFSDPALLLPVESKLRAIPVVPWRPGTGIQVLGVPVCFPGDDAYARHVWGKRADKVCKILRVLEELPQAHVQYTLLRYCLAACRVMDLLRGCPIGHATEECKRFSIELRRCMDHILGAPCTDDQWSQASLAIRCGGLGVTDPEQQRPAARMSGLLNFVQNGPRVLGIEGTTDFVPIDVPETVSRLQLVVQENSMLQA